MSDAEFAEAVDRVLWIGPSGESRDNAGNYYALRCSLDERRHAINLLHELLAALLPLRLWREHARAAAPLLEAMIFVREQSGGEELSGEE